MADTKARWWHRRRISVALLLCLVLFVLYGLRASFSETGFLGERASSDSADWRETAIDLPNGHGRLIFGQKPAHLFLAEYYYRVRIETERSRGVTRSLPPNAGGNYDIDVLWHPMRDGVGPFVELTYVHGDYLFDVLQDSAFELRTMNGEIYLGEVIDGRWPDWTIHKWGHPVEPQVNGVVIDSSQDLLDYSSVEVLGTIKSSGNYQPAEP